MRRVLIIGGKGGIGQALSRELAGYEVITAGRTGAGDFHYLGSEAMRKAMAQRHALGRVGAPEDIAKLAAWVLSSASSWMTGQILGLDGGISSVKI